MSAVFREEVEVPVISNDVLEAQLLNLRDGVQEVRASQSVLQSRLDKTNERIEVVNATLSAKIDKTNDRIDAVNTSLSAKIEAVNANLSTRIDAVNTTLSAKIDTVNASLSTRIDAVNTTLSAKIDTVNANLSTRIDAVNERLSAKIDKTLEKMDAFKGEILARFDKQGEQLKLLGKGVDWVHISAKVVLTILGLCVSAAVIVNTLRALRWI